MRRAWMLGLIAVAGCRPAGRAEADAGAEPKGERDAEVEASTSTSTNATAVRTDWCVEGMKPLGEDVCYVLPPLAEGKARRLLVYLHGIVPPVAESAQKTAVQGAVMRAAARAGAAAIVPRGRRGIGPAGAKDWYAWPTDPATHAKLVKELVARWALAKKQLEAIAGAPFEKTYLAGSSNGAYFLSAIALRGDVDDLDFAVDGYGAMSGGAPGGRGADALAKRTPRPFYVGYGAYDDESKKGAKALARVAAAAHWPTKLAEHPVGHGAREVYLDEAFVFWAAP